MNFSSLMPLIVDSQSPWHLALSQLLFLFSPIQLVYSPGLALASTVHLEFIYNFQDIQVGVRNQFGYMKSGSSENTTMTMSKQPSITRPLSVS